MSIFSDRQEYLDEFDTLKDRCSKLESRVNALERENRMLFYDPRPFMIDQLDPNENVTTPRQVILMILEQLGLKLMPGHSTDAHLEQR